MFTRPQNRSFRLWMYLLAILSVVPPMAAFTYCSINFILIGMLVCFVLSIVFPVLLVKAAQSRPVPPRNVDDQLRKLIARKKKLEQQLGKE